MAQHNAIPATKEAIEAEARRQQASLEPQTLRALHITQAICANSNIPDGWIKINDSWDPTNCGNPTEIVYNIWTIEYYLGKPTGTVLTVCAGAPTPSGWVDVGTSWDPTSCGHPSTIVQNMKQIKKL